VSKRWIVGDTETTGTGPGTGVCELAFAELDDDLNVIDRHTSLIDPQRPITASASGIHGITNADVADAPTMDQFFEYFYPGKRITGDVVFIAHKADFDLPFFKPYIDNLAGVLCTLRLARKVFPDAENHKLQTLMYVLGLTVGDKHRAAADVETTIELLRKIVAQSGASLEQLTEEAARPVWISTMPFSKKYKGWPIETVPHDFIDWWFRQTGDKDPDLLWTLKRVRAGEGPA
jgi:DNA polymerase III epsilon subunit-like protein